CLRAASWRRLTSFGVRYSRSRRSALRGRRGVTVRFTMVERAREVIGFLVANAVFREDTVRITRFLRKDVRAARASLAGTSKARSGCGAARQAHRRAHV